MFAKLAIAALAATTALAGPTRMNARQDAAAANFAGDATYYAVGLGACGDTNTDSEFVVAINNPQYESNGGTPNGGGPCGKFVQITDTQTGVKQIAKVVDRCPGCKEGDLDMSPSLFAALHNGNMDAGRFPISWEFIDAAAAATATATA